MTSYTRGTDDYMAHRQHEEYRGTPKAFPKNPTNIHVLLLLNFLSVCFLFILPESLPYVLSERRSTSTLHVQTYSYIIRTTVTTPSILWNTKYFGTPGILVQALYTTASHFCAPFLCIFNHYQNIIKHPHSFTHSGTDVIRQS